MCCSIYLHTDQDYIEESLGFPVPISEVMGITPARRLTLWGISGMWEPTALSCFEEQTMSMASSTQQMLTEACGSWSRALCIAEMSS